jgi:hypothetical protein
LRWISRIPVCSWISPTCSAVAAGCHHQYSPLPATMTTANVPAPSGSMSTSRALWSSSNPLIWSTVLAGYHQVCSSSMPLFGMTIALYRPLPVGSMSLTRPPNCATFVLMKLSVLSR